MESTFKLFLSHCGIAISLASGIAHAGQATIPNTFVSGTAAKASEVNGNFNSLKTAVDDNDARTSTNASGISQNAADIANIPAQKQVVAVDANGYELGLIYGGDNLVYSILTLQGYTAEITSSNGQFASGLDIAGISFTDSDCGNSGGQAYTAGLGGRHIAQGTVIAPFSDSSQPQSPLPFYVPKPATFVNNITVQSEQTASGCQQYNILLQSAQEVFPNDPAITGFPNTPPAPLTIDYR